MSHTQNRHLPFRRGHPHVAWLGSSPHLFSNTHPSVAGMVCVGGGGDDEARRELTFSKTVTLGDPGGPTRAVGGPPPGTQPRGPTRLPSSHCGFQTDSQCTSHLLAAGLLLETPAGSVCLADIPSRFGGPGSLVCHRVASSAKA